jgi:cysteine desulfurase
MVKGGEQAMEQTGTDLLLSLTSPPSPCSLYLDNNATTPVLPEVLQAMQPFLAEVFGNPSSAHQHGRRARKALEDAREQIAAHLDAHPDEVIFTSGATEANNLAVLGLAGDPPGHLVSSTIEHPCVIEPLRQLSQRGFTLDWLPVEETETIRARTLRPDSRLVCVMLVNHETGAVQPVKELAALVPDAAFHCDAAQAVGKMPVRFHDLGVTSLSLSAHKFHGPKGIGALLLNRCAKMRPLFWGGHQQRGLRPGTEPVALIAGMAGALEIAVREQDQRFQHVRQMRELFLGAVREGAAPAVLNGSESAALPHTLNLSFPGLKSDALLMAFDLAGVACSTGSACSSGSLLPSPVLQALGVPEDVLRSAMRFSFSHLLTLDDAAEAAQRVVRVVRRLRDTPDD